MLINWLDNRSFLLIKYSGLGLIGIYAAVIVYLFGCKNKKPINRKIGRIIFHGVNFLYMVVAVVIISLFRQGILMHEEFMNRVDQTQRSEASPEFSKNFGLLNYQELVANAYDALKEFENLNVADDLSYTCLNFIGIKSEFYAGSLALEALIKGYHLELLSTPRFYNDYMSTAELLASDVIETLHTACSSLRDFQIWMDVETLDNRLKPLKEKFVSNEIDFAPTNYRFKGLITAIIHKMSYTSENVWPLTACMIVFASFGIFLNFRYHSIGVKQGSAWKTRMIYGLMTLFMILAFFGHFFVMGLISATIQAADKAATKRFNSKNVVEVTSNNPELYQQLNMAIQYIESLKRVDLDGYSSKLDDLILSYKYGDSLEFDGPQNKIDIINEHLKCQSMEVHFTMQTCSKSPYIKCFTFQNGKEEDFKISLHPCVRSKLYVELLFKEISIYLKQEKKAMNASLSLFQSLVQKFRDTKAKYDIITEKIVTKITIFAKFTEIAELLNTFIAKFDMSRFADEHLNEFRNQLSNRWLDFTEMSMFAYLFLAIMKLAHLVIS